MWHKKQRRRLGVVSEHRASMLKNIVKGLIEHGRVRTTLPRAREASIVADKLISMAKKKTLHSRRQVFAKLNSASATKRICDEIAPLFETQAGGYTRVIRHNFRPGDGAAMAFLEFVKMPQTEEEKKVKKTKKKAKKEEAVKKEEDEPKEKLKEKKAVKKPAEEKKTEEKKADKKDVPASEEEMPKQEEPKKGGFLGGLRKFLTGD